MGTSKASGRRTNHPGFPANHDQDLSQGQDSLAHHIKNFNVKLFANAGAGGSTIALPGLHPGELINWTSCVSHDLPL